MICKEGIHDASDPAGIDALTEYTFKVNEFLGSAHNVAARQGASMISFLNTAKDGTAVQRLTDQILLLWIEQMRDYFVMIAHNCRPEIDDLGIAHVDITGRETFQTCGRTLSFTNRV